MVTAGLALGKFLARRDWVGLAVVALATALLLAYRAAFIEPRTWGAICAASSPPLACLPRTGLLWMQQRYLWGAIALVLGLLAFLVRAPFAVRVMAVVAGMAAVANYNATWGMIGAALGAWAWLRPSQPAARQ